MPEEGNALAQRLLVDWGEHRKVVAKDGKEA